MLVIDPESRASLRLSLNKIIDSHTKALPDGQFYDANGAFKVGVFEYNRGIIEGLKMVLSLLDPSTSTDTHSEENENEQDAA